MTKSELIEALKGVPDDTKLYLLDIEYSQLQPVTEVRQRYVDPYDFGVDKVFKDDWLKIRQEYWTIQ
jgi:hypothetical protein